MVILVSRLLYECDGEVPLEYCFFHYPPRHIILSCCFATQYDYPHSPPQAYQAPFVNDLDLMDPVETFHRLWAGQASTN